MNSVTPIRNPLTVSLLISTLVLCSCSGTNDSGSGLPASGSLGSGSSGSGNATSGNATSGNSDSVAGPQSPSSATEGGSNGTNTADDGTDNSSVQNASGSAVAATQSAAPESTLPLDAPLDSPAIVPDPLAKNLTTVEFQITVPAYISNELQLRVLWGEQDFTAFWVGDEQWSATAEFPTRTEHRLEVTFYDKNGLIPLASYAENFATGTNASESVVITADQFDTDRWDSDGDGVSNINELIAGTDPIEATRILLFSETQDFRHASTEVALVALEELADSAGMQTARADDSAGVFTNENLANYAAVVWVMTSGNVLNPDEQSAFELFIRMGGGYAGIHAASFTEYEWPWYGRLVGAYFERHPVVQTATQIVEDRSHSSTLHLGQTWTRTDEWYDYRSNPRGRVQVLLRLDEESYSGGGMGVDHPSAWYHEYEGGRSWYTGGGHTTASYAETDFRAHLLGGLRYAAGLKSATR